MANPAEPELFAHCLGDSDATWTTFYALACLCHPCQGGERHDMAELCAQARVALGDEWPGQWDGDALPNLFDVYCLATKTRNPFGSSITPGEVQDTKDQEEPRAWNDDRDEPHTGDDDGAGDDGRDEPRAWNDQAEAPAQDGDLPGYSPRAVHASPCDVYASPECDSQ